MTVPRELAPGLHHRIDASGECAPGCPACSRLFEAGRKSRDWEIAALLADLGETEAQIVALRVSLRMQPDNNCTLGNECYAACQQLAADERTETLATEYAESSEHTRYTERIQRETIERCAEAGAEASAAFDKVMGGLTFSTGPRCAAVATAIRALATKADT